MTKEEIKDVITRAVGDHFKSEIEKTVKKELLQYTTPVHNKMFFDSPETLDLPKVRGKTYRKLFGEDTLSNDGFEKMEDFYKTLHSNRADTRLKTMVEGTLSGGGALVPTQYAAEMLDHALEEEIVRPRARVYPMTSEILMIPGFILGDHSSNLFGGVIGRWGPEATSKTASAPELRRIQLTAQKLYCYTQSSDELWQDSKISFSDMIGTALTKAIGWYLDYAFLRGTGAGMPLGILNSNCLIAISEETGQDADTIIWENIVNMWARLAPSSQKNAIWIASQSTIPQLFTLSQAVGTGGTAYQPALREASGRIKLLGKDVIFTEKLPILGDQGDLMLCDLSSYAIGMRQDVRLESSNAPNFQSDVRDWRAVLRCTGQPIQNESLTLKDGSTTVSPFVCIEERTGS